MVVALASIQGQDLFFKAKAKTWPSTANAKKEFWKSVNI